MLRLLSEPNLLNLLVWHGLTPTFSQGQTSRLLHVQQLKERLMVQFAGTLTGSNFHSKCVTVLLAVIQEAAAEQVPGGV